MSDRAFTVATATNSVAAFARTRLAPALLPLAVKASKGRAYLFRTGAELNIGYRRSQLSVDGPGTRRRGFRAGDRLADAPVVHNGFPTTVHAGVAEPGWHLLLCGPAHRGPEELQQLGRRYRGLLTVHRLTGEPDPDALYDPTGMALARLGVPAKRIAVLLVRPDGHIGFRASIADMQTLVAYLDHWLPQPNGDP
jgi:hypothetical protein